MSSRSRKTDPYPLQFTSSVTRITLSQSELLLPSSGRPKSAKSPRSNSSMSFSFDFCRHSYRRLSVLLLLFICFALACGGSGGSQGISSQQNPVPSISKVTPNSATAGSGALTITVSGSEFVAAICNRLERCSFNHHLRVEHLTYSPGFHVGSQRGWDGKYSGSKPCARWR